MTIDAEEREFFHVAPIPLTKDSVIEIGNWGRMIRAVRFGNGALPNYLVRELVYEQVRLVAAAAKPSRLAGIFIFETPELASAMALRKGRRDIAYAVQLVSPQAPIHRAGFNLVHDSPPAEEPTLPWWENRARAYWAGEEINVPELLTLSALRIVRRLG
jgi:hypothetical protein